MVKFVDGKRYDFTPVKLTDQFAAFEDSKVVFMADLGLDTLIHNDAEITVRH